nr:peptidylprolyl isomerase [Sphingomonas quercus]
MVSRFPRLAAAFLPLGLIAVAVPAVAQMDASPADNPVNSADNLKLPSSVELFGKADPNVRKATAIVNGAIITDTDVDQRLNLFLAANGGKIEGEERERLRLQVLRNLIDESLEIQEARANDITITRDELTQAFNRVAGNFRRTPKDFGEYLKSMGSSEASIRRQIEGELAWQRLLRRRVEPFVNVGEEEVRSVINRLNAAKGTNEYRVGEIFLSATPENTSEVFANAQRIVTQIRGGASFVAYARQYSEASTAAVGGDLGWVRAEQLPEPLSNAIKGMRSGELSEPIPIPGGFSVLVLIDQRQVLTANPRDAMLSLKQVSLKFPPGASRASAAPLVEKLAAAGKAVQGCGNVDAMVAGLPGAEVVQNDSVRAGDLPPQLQDMILNLSVGQATQPFGSLEDGVRVLVLCGRDDPEQAKGPSPEQIMAQMEEERVNMRARRYLRDLRRDAVVDYR